MYNKNARIDLRKFTRKNKSCQFGENRIPGYISLPEIYLETKKKKKRKFANPTPRYYKLFNRPNNSRWGTSSKLEGKAGFREARFQRANSSEIAPLVSQNSPHRVLDDNWCLHTPLRLQCSIISLSTVIPRPVYFSEIKFPAGPVEIRNLAEAAAPP